MNKQSSLATRGITTETLTMIRTRFILEWFDKYAAKFPYKLFDYERQLYKKACSALTMNGYLGPLKTSRRTIVGPKFTMKNIKTSSLFKRPGSLK